MDSLEELHNDLFAKFVPSKEFLLELQKAATSATLMQDAKHFLGCLAEMLTFFICIFFLKQWLQFDLFRDYPWAQAETAVFHLNNNNVKSNLKSLKSKRFWKRKNRSRSPSRSVGRSEISEEIFTSSEDNCSSISIDNVSSDLTDSDIEDSIDLDIIDNQNNLDDLDDDLGAEINDAETEDSFHSNLLQQEELSDDNDGTISDAPSLDSQLSWFQEHYIESSESDSR